MPLHLPNEEVKSRGGVIIRDVVHHSGVGYICNIRTRIIVFYDTDVRASTFLFLIPFVYIHARAGLFAYKAGEEFGARVLKWFQFY